MPHEKKLNWDVIVLGAGAAGCMAAITAARCGASVLLLEQNDRIGKKILATGNGKCNYTNANMTIEAFRGNRKMVQNALESFGMEETLAFFHEIGIYPRYKNGYYYPNSQTASSVRNALEAELARCGVEVQTGVTVTEIIPTDCAGIDEPQDNRRGIDSKKDTDSRKNADSRRCTDNSRFTDETESCMDDLNKFRIIATGSDFFCRKLILATGLLASPKSGSNGSAFELIKSLGHHFTDIVPALCGFYAKGLDFHKTAGVRTDAKVTLYIDGGEALMNADGCGFSKGTASRDMTFAGVDESHWSAIPGAKAACKISDTGELQLTDYGISGIPVFQISRYASYALKKGHKTEVSIDFLPALTMTEVREEIMQRFQKSHKPGKTKTDAKEKIAQSGANMENRQSSANARIVNLRVNAGSRKSGESLDTYAYSAIMCMNGLLNEKLTPALFKLAGISPSAAAAEVPEYKIERLCAICKDCRVTLTDSRGFEFAQVCAGGIVSEEVDECTLESKLVQGLYFAGELLDVDGICGGYNLQWAWSSGYVVGREAAG